MADVNSQAKTRHQGYKNKGKDPDVSNHFKMLNKTEFFVKLCALAKLYCLGVEKLICGISKFNYIPGLLRTHYYERPLRYLFHKVIRMFFFCLFVEHEHSICLEMSFDATMFQFLLSLSRLLNPQSNANYIYFNTSNL